MGCCETREEFILKEEKPKENKSKDEQSKENKSKEGKPKKKTSKIISFSQMQDQDFLYVPDRSPLTKQLNLSNNSNSLRLYIEWCRSLRKWSEMSEYLGDFTQIVETRKYISGAREPQSISSLIVTYLYLELQKDPSCVLMAVENVIIEIVRLISNNSEDFRDCSLCLLNSYLGFSNEKVIKSLVRFGLFEVINEFLTNTDQDLTLMTLAISTKVYKNRAFAQINFVENDGLTKLLLMLQDPTSSEQLLTTLLQSLFHLIKLEEPEVNKKVLSAIKPSTLLTVLKTLQVQKTISPDCIQLLNLITNN